MPPPAEQLAPRLLAGPALRAQPDRRLVRLVREGYEAAFEEIVRRYTKPLGRYAAAIVGGRSEDVTQDAFSKALLALRRDGAKIELRPWLYRIVRNTALNDLRDRPPPPETLAETIASGRGPSEEAEQREDLAELTARLRALPEPQRAAIVMRELEGLGHEEIAAALGMSGGAARQAIYRARQALRDGFGMLLPLPLLKSMLAAGTPGAVETATATGAAAAGLALKAGAATMLVAGAVGTGVALHAGREAAGPVRAAEVAHDPAGAADPSAGPAEHLPGGRSGGGEGRDTQRDGRHAGDGGGPRSDGGDDDDAGGRGDGDSGRGGEDHHSGGSLPSSSGHDGGGSGDDSGSSGGGSDSADSDGGSSGSGDSGEPQPGGEEEPSGTSGGGSDGGSSSSGESGSESGYGSSGTSSLSLPTEEAD